MNVVDKLKQEVIELAELNHYWLEFAPPGEYTRLSSIYIFCSNYRKIYGYVGRPIEIWQWPGELDAGSTKRCKRYKILLKMKKWLLETTERDGAGRSVLVEEREKGQNEEAMKEFGLTAEEWEHTNNCAWDSWCYTHKKVKS